MVARGGETGEIVGGLDDDRGGAFHLGNRGFGQVQKLRVSNHNLGFAMFKDIADRIDIQTGVDRVQHRATGGHAETGFGLRRNVGDQRGHYIARFDTQLDQTRGQTCHTFMIFRIGLPVVAIDHRQPVGKNACGAAQMR